MSEAIDELREKVGDAMIDAGMKLPGTFDSKVDAAIIAVLDGIRDMTIEVSWHDKRVKVCPYPLAIDAIKAELQPPHTSKEPIQGIIPPDRL